MRKNKVLMMIIASLFGTSVAVYTSSVHATPPDSVESAEETEIATNAEYELLEQEEKHAEVELQKKPKSSKEAQTKARSKTANPAH